MANTWMLADSVIQAHMERVHLWLIEQTGLTLELFKNDHDPAEGDTLETYTPCDFPGYAPFDLSEILWAFPSLASNVASSEYGDLLQWTVAANPDPEQTVYGYFIGDEDGNLQWAERFETPRRLHVEDQLDLTIFFRYTVLASG